MTRRGEEGAARHVSRQAAEEARGRRRVWRESSAAHLHGEAVIAHPGETAAAARERIRAARPAAWELLCVVDEKGHLVGALTPAELLALPDAADVAAAARRAVTPHVAHGADQERMASLALRHGVSAMPVVDDDGRLLGVVGALALMRILRREHVEDLHRLAGIAREPQPMVPVHTKEVDEAMQAMEAPPLRQARHRLPWLLVGLAGSMLATFVVARFESALAAKPALAFFVPGLVYLADAIGTQTEAVAVRGLSLGHAHGHPPLSRLLASELRTGLVIGFVLALLALPMVWAVFGELRLALAVSLALAGASLVASVLGLLLPWALARFGSDPAYGSGPLATIVQDLLSLVIYFASVSAIVL